MKNKNILYFLFITALLLTNFVYSQTMEELIETGDKYQSEFNNEKALEEYQKADELSPENWEIYWRISRAYVDIGEHMPTSTSEQEDTQLATYEKAYDYANKAVEFAPDQSITYLRRAIANGRIALFKGVFSVGGIVNAAKEDLEKAIKLGNGGSEVQATAHYVLGRTHAKVSEKWAPARAVLGLGWADIDTALVEYQTAIDLRQNYCMFYMDYAKALIEEDDFEKAKDMLRKTIESPIQDEDDEVKKEEAMLLLKEIEEEK